MRQFVSSPGLSGVHPLPSARIDLLWRFKLLFQAQCGERLALAELMSDEGLRRRTLALAERQGDGELLRLVAQLRLLESPLAAVKRA